MMSKQRVGAGATVVAALAVVLAGCGTQRAGDAGAGTPTGAPGAVAQSAGTPTGAPLDFACPGESAAPTTAPATTSTSSVPPTDHYAENHGFMMPFPLHGRARCDGLAAVGRVKGALEPLRKRGDFDPKNSRAALIRLGYAAAGVTANQNGPTGVSFLIDAYPLCVEGTMDLAVTAADAFGGYPDHPACDRPLGGH